MKHEQKYVEESVRPVRRYRERPGKKKSKLFKKVLLVWCAVLVVGIIAAVIYVNGVLRELQANTPSQIVKDVIGGLSDSQVKELFITDSPYEDGKGLENIRKFFADGEYTVKKVSGKDDYKVYNGKRLLFTIKLDKKGSKTGLAIFNYNLYDVAGIEAGPEKQLYTATVTAPSACRVEINGKEAEPTSKEELTVFSDASSYVQVPTVDSYVFSGLTKAPEIKITRDGKELDFEASENIVIEGPGQPVESLEAAGCDFDILTFAENWSRFMTKDLSGTYYGFYNLAESFINGSEMYTKARKWATGVDITFTSRHTLKNPAFTGKTYENVVKYSDDLISVDVHLVKHMLLSTGLSVDDKLDNTVYLAKYEGSWKVVNMRSIAEKQ